MELIYLYIGDIDRPLRNQGIRFGGSYYVEYDPETRRLTIDPHESAAAGLYEPRVKSLDLLVGKNGTGKTTAFELLGLPRQDRVNVFPISDGKGDGTFLYKHAWFALYHIRGDRFALEGYWIDLVDFAPHEHLPYFQPVYSAEFRYDTRTHRMLTPPFYLQELEPKDGMRRVTDELFYVLYQSQTGNSWYDAPRRSGLTDAGRDFLFHRVNAQQVGFSGIMKYLYASLHDRDFAARMASRPGSTVRIELHEGDKSEVAGYKAPDRYADTGEILRIAAQYIYGGEETLLKPVDPRFQEVFGHAKPEPYTRRQTMALVYLEELAFYGLTQDEVPSEHPYKKTQSYEDRRDHLLKQVDERDEIDGGLAKQIVEGIEAIPEKYFTKGTEVEIRLRDMSDNFLTPLMQTLDNDRQRDDHEINHRFYIRVSFEGLSTGEAQYLDLFASLYSAVRVWPHRKGDTCVLLLDEPDHRFHPEWSRSFILSLTELLETEAFCEYNYQIIISTHSPLLLSDVPREHIHCLQRDGRTGEIRAVDSSRGFMSSLNDLMVDSFFTDSVFGAFAERYANGLIADINTLEEETLDANGGDGVMEKAAGLRRRLDVIEDELIHASLERRIDRIERRARRNGHDPHRN